MLEKVYILTMSLLCCVGLPALALLVFLKFVYNVLAWTPRSR